ncbi:MAG: PA2169 family four-helix-bundle protein [Gemmatimonadales bacterium]|nr:PA2169 family four-helix-bundle protein [Gemmatimonadales bacterium]
MTTTTNTPGTSTPNTAPTGISSAHAGLLNDLLQLNHDSAEGLAKAKELATSAKLKTLFDGARTERMSAVQALEPLVRAAGGKPDKDLSVSGSLRRTWMKIRETLSPDGDKALIMEVERAEDEMKEAYQEAMRKPLPPAIKPVIEAQARQVFAVHDTFSNLKHGRSSL